MSPLRSRSATDVDDSKIKWGRSRVGRKVMRETEVESEKLIGRK